MGDHDALVGGSVAIIGGLVAELVGWNQSKLGLPGIGAHWFDLGRAQNAAAAYNQTLHRG